MICFTLALKIYICNRPKKKKMKMKHTNGISLRSILYIKNKKHICIATKACLLPPLMTVLLPSVVQCADRSVSVSIFQSLIKHYVLFFRSDDFSYTYTPSSL